MKNEIRSILVSKRNFFLCLSLLACGSVGDNFTIPIPDKHDAELADAHPRSDKMPASAPKLVVQAAAAVVHEKVSSAGAVLPTFRNMSSSDGQDAESRSRLLVPTTIVGSGFANAGLTHFDTLQLSSSPDQADGAAGNYASGGAHGGIAGAAATGGSEGVQGSQTSPGLATAALGGGCLASLGTVTTLPLGARFCFVADSEAPSGQGSVIAQADTDTQPLNSRQSISVAQRREGGAASGSGGGIIVGPYVPNSPPSSPTYSSPSSPSGSLPSLTAPIVADITPFTTNPVIEINIVGSGVPNDTPTADSPVPTAVPEPAALDLVFLGLVGLLVTRNRKIVKRLLP